MMNKKWIGGGLVVALIAIFAVLVYNRDSDLDDVKDATQEAVEVSGDYVSDTVVDIKDRAFGQKNTFVDEAKERLRELRDEMEKLPGEVSADMQDEMEALSTAIDEAETSSKENWEEAKTKVKKIYEDIWSRTLDEG